MEKVFELLTRKRELETFNSLYKENKTQAETAKEFNVSVCLINTLNKRILHTIIACYCYSKEDNDYDLWIKLKRDETIQRDLCRNYEYLHNKKFETFDQFIDIINNHPDELFKYRRVGYMSINKMIAIAEENGRFDSESFEKILNSKSENEYNIKRYMKEYYKNRRKIENVEIKKEKEI